MNKHNVQKVGGLQSLVCNPASKYVIMALAMMFMLGLGGSAHAVPNAGVTEVVTAIEALAPDLATVVTAAIGVAVIGIAAAAAIKLGKRLMS